MNATPDCIVCMMRQMLNTMRVVTDDEVLQRKGLDALARLLPEVDLANTPATESRRVYRLVSELTGNPDPYREVREQTNREAMAHLGEARELFAAAETPDARLDAALHLAAAGNIIDLGIGQAYSLEDDLRRLLAESFARDDQADFRREAVAGAKLLYLADNSGEIVFDRFLIEELLARGVEVTLAVKSGPIINDALREDAEMAGLTELVPVIETGGADVGVDFDNISGEFRDVFAGADLILGKGQGNFETCDERPENVYFLLTAKCEVIARHIGVPLGRLVFLHKPAGSVVRPPQA